MKKLSVFLFMVVLVFGVAGISNGTTIDISQIQAFGTIGWGESHPEKTIDGDRGTHWVGTDDLQYGETNYLAYHFSNKYSVSQIDFYDDFNSEYNLGELDIQTSQNSTDGFDGIWTTIDHIDGDFTYNDFSRIVDIGSTTWVRLWMTYEGRGAPGISPAFYLSEIEFHGAAPVPEPATILLFVTGLVGLVGFRKKLKR